MLVSRFSFLSLLAALLVFAGIAQAFVDDVDAPVITALSFTPASIDTTTGPRDVIVTATVTDSLSGVASVWGSFYSPSGRQVRGFSMGRVSGDSLNGVYRGTAAFLTYNEDGTWVLGAVQLMDSAGNRRYYRTADLVAKGFPVSLTVVSIPDTHAPDLAGVTWITQQVDVSNGPADASVRVSFKEDLSGLNFLQQPTCALFDFQLRSPSGKQLRYIYHGDFKLVAGDELNGTFEGSLRMPVNSEPGVWRVSTVEVYDKAGNRASWDSAQLAALGFDAPLKVLSPNPDTTPPALTSLSVSPAFINTSTGPADVTVQLSATDDLAGVLLGPTSPQCSYVDVGGYFVSPSGGQNHWVSPWGGWTLAAGTPLNGSWTGKMTFPRYSEEGTWKVNSLRAEDRTGNSLYLNNQQLVALGLAPTIEIIKPSGAIDGVVGPSGGTIKDGSFGDRAKIVFPPNVIGANTNVAIDVLAHAPNTPIPSGFAANGSNFVNVDLNPHPPMPLPAPGLTVTLPLINLMIPGTKLTLMRINPANNTMVPAMSVSGGWVVGSVDASGDSATFSEVATLSTVAGLTSMPTTPGDLNGDLKVDCADVAIVKASFGKKNGQPGFDLRADINRNGIVDVNDLAFVTRLLPAGTVCK